MTNSDSDDREVDSTDNQNEKGKKEIRIHGDTNRINIVQQIELLSEIPEIKDYFSRALLEARYIFKDKIEEYHNVKNNIKREVSREKPGEVKEEEIPDLPQPLAKSKTYFFELTRLEHPEKGFQWELGKFKLQANEKTVNMIFSDFISEVDEYEIAPHRIQENTVYSPPLDKWFQIKFTKSSHTRVVGFVKEVDKEDKKAKKTKVEMKDFVVKRNRHMLKLATVMKTVGIEELKEFIENNPGFTEDMLFSLRIKRLADLPN
ncbi:MAG: hypothetical protein GTN82_12845 [Candidatus Aminicenantes bacterium]|nr:hypothetical protein [Candidatus Aminicenantes bacterium]